MSATTVATTTVDDELDGLLADIFGGDLTISRRQLADRLGISLDNVKAAISRGDLGFIRVSPRRTVITRAGVRHYLQALRDQ